MASPQRVSINIQNVSDSIGHSELMVLILTNGQGAPLATLADNDGFPTVISLYAKAVRIDQGTVHSWAILLHVIFAAPIPATAQGLAVNCYQADATEYVFPWIP